MAMVESLIEFFQMGGYASFIWPSWGIGFGVIIAITIISRRQSSAIKAKLIAMDKNRS
jgi:heme exporter protein CcmD